MGVEIREQRSVTRYLLWGSLVVVVAYLLATWGGDGDRARVRRGQ